MGDMEGKASKKYFYVSIATFSAKLGLEIILTIDRSEIFKLLTQVMLLCLAEKWLSVSLPACMIVVYVVQKVRLRTLRQLRVLEQESTVGVFWSFLESVRIKGPKVVD